MGKLNRLFKVSKDKIDQCQFDFIMDNIKAVIQHDRQTPKFEYKSEKADDKINEIKIEEATNEDDYVAESLLEIFPEYSKTFIAVSIFALASVLFILRCSNQGLKNNIMWHTI